MNPGGLRTDLLHASSPAGEGDGNVTYRELFDVQPFSNTVNAVTLTGADIKQLLEQQFPGAARDSTLLLSTSDGFAYEYDPAGPEGDRVFACSITIGGVPVHPAGSYRVAANSFLIAGGTDPVTGPLDVDTAVSYQAENSPLTPPAGDHANPVTTSSC